MRLPESCREDLKTPLGVLLPDAGITKEQVAGMIRPGSYVVTVGDRTTERMIQFGIVPSLQITDGLEKRRIRPHPRLAETGGADDDVKEGEGRGAGARHAGSRVEVKTTVMEVSNPPAQITRESVSAIRKAFAARPPVRIRVDGEEDLLVIPVCVYAPDNTVVLYGQPDEGLVVTPVTDEIRNKTRGIMSHMG
ncbi:MAG: GTP-dependent dephospho-CoA kinase family protein [Thaumarchaeota archaeon]|nr:GTP-dependent dephospho-CoA kinase family protein [Nitrososphaerota archaeon]